MRSAAVWLVLATATSAMAAPAPAPPASGGAYELRWERAPGAETCSGAEELAGAVSGLLGRPAFDGAGAGAIVVEGAVRKIEGIEGGWQVTIAIRGADGSAQGTRQLEQSGDDCRALDEALALVLALIVDPEAGAAPAPAPIVVVSTPPPVVAARGPSWRADATLAGAAGAGALPGGSLGGTLAVGVDSPRMWPISVSLGWWRSTSVEIDGDGRAVTLARWQVGAVVCTPDRRVGPVALAACGGGGVARVAARGINFDRDLEAQATVGLASLHGRGAVALAGPTFLAVEAAGEVALVRPRFVDSAQMTVHQVARLAVSGSLGLGVHF